ncbi:ornithine carbamoyltransferase [Magnetospirillum moscoviense]|uniref:Ornithine carbamoyltransferase n=1 Tax=Magnetospirillum moscoviense TaxID=1437059 RepID=A0A178MY32_9PROT|nr:ornithine carbamoyltransferase [Magnetospirillum moscoviense]MBF0327123.1 ornithine carbamoyltransferase [Alphaproteobacteria bacterium]OAN60949.1 ornithine carbamoyltransferase [Magnetospirillum moscoviense]
MTVTPGRPRAGQTRHFLDLDRFDTETLRRILDLGAAYKRGEKTFGKDKPLAGRLLAMIFEKPSTRTRVSFEAGMKQLGGDVIVLARGDSQLGRGETVADTARVLSRYVDAIMIRTDDAQKLHDLAQYATVPVINGLTDDTHPCQVMADIMTFEEHRGSLDGKVVAWVGDGNNVAASWIQASAHFGFEIRLACPPELTPNGDVVAWARDNGGNVVLGADPKAAAQGAHLVLTDTWVSMGCTDGNRHQLLAPYQVNEALMAQAAPDALFMHCLPAHRGEEVTDPVMDGPQSVVWDEAENRLHVQKGIMSWCLL